MSLVKVNAEFGFGKQNYPYSELLHCNDCGAPMVAAKKVWITDDGEMKYSRHYACDNNFCGLCSSKPLPAEMVDVYFG